VTKGLVYYSDCRGDSRILTTVRRQLARVAGGFPLVAVTLQPVSSPEGWMNLVLPLDRGRLTMFTQILKGLEALETDVAFLVEHDVLYPEEHFLFDPPRPDTYYYNQHTWRVDAKTGHALFYRCNQTSGLCADRRLLLQHYTARVERTQREGYDHRTGYEPGSHRPPRGIDDVPVDTWWSSRPLVDIRHGCNLTANRWHPSQFRDKNSCLDWTESDHVPGWWGRTEGRFDAWLAGIGGNDDGG